MKYPEATILIVEDNRDDALLIQRALRRANLINPLQVVANGEQAIGYLKGDGPYADRSSYPLRFCTPQFQLRTLHDGSPGLANFGL